MIRPRGLRPKRPSLWRTATLVGVHLLMAAHIAQWWFQGTTMSPLEPSEGMELAKHGIVNAGLVFFVVAIATTMVFGRFFCGWGCHLIALQDLSRWLLIKAGLQPRPLRSRLLGLVPFVAFAYMFLWPAVFKLAVGEPLGPVTTAMTTADFWATFPGLGVAMLTFVVCGFAVVFVLGSKGYCSYGCPYGAAFAVADRVAPVRVRVTDACAGCATCTSVCTSNVRVHEEVRSHGMVVDPGCMKCLDCVASCPNDALYVGAGSPSLLDQLSRRGRGSLAWGEEVLAAVVFVVAFAAFRGAYGVIPFLLALGLASMLAGAVVAVRRMARRPDAWIGPVRLRRQGTLRPAGVVFAGAMVAAGLVWGHAAVSRVLDRHAVHLDRKLLELKHASLRIDADPRPSSSEAMVAVGEARRAMERAVAWSPVHRPDLALSRAWLAMLDGDSGAARRLVGEAVDAQPLLTDVHLLAARVSASAGDTRAAVEAYSRVIDLAPDNVLGPLGLGSVLGESGRIEAAREVFLAGLERRPESVDLLYNLAVADAMLGFVDAAVEGFSRVLERAPDHHRARENLAGTLASAGRFAEAVPVYEEAIRRRPDVAGLRLTAARACVAAGDRRRADAHLVEAVRLDPSLAVGGFSLD